MTYSLNSTTNMSTPYTLLIDSLPVLEVLRKAPCTTEKSLVIDLQTSKDNFRRFEHSDVVFVPFGINAANALSKNKIHYASIWTLSSSVLSHLVG